MAAAWFEALAGVFCRCEPPPFVRRLFRDLKLLSALMSVWLLVVLFIMVEIGVLNNPTFVAWGPRPTLSFLHVPIDTPYKYSILLLMVMVHTFISDFISDGLVPHVINQLQDVRCRRLPHTHAIYYVVTTVWSLYSAVSQLFLIFLALGQLDLLLVRLFSDLAANLVTTRLYLENKAYDPTAVLLDDDDDTLIVYEAPRAARSAASSTASAAPAEHHADNNNNNSSSSSESKKKMAQAARLLRDDDDGAGDDVSGAHI